MYNIYSINPTKKNPVIIFNFKPEKLNVEKE